MVDIGLMILEVRGSNPWCCSYIFMIAPSFFARWRRVVQFHSARLSGSVWRGIFTLLGVVHFDLALARGSFSLGVVHLNFK
jgi:hypothetical protein